MTDKPRTSIIIPTYNRREYLEKCIDSVLGSGLDDLEWEIIVVDDGSADNTREMILGWKHPRIFYLYQSNKGAPAAWNTGIRWSTGEYLVFVASDNMILHNGISVPVNFLKDNPDVGFCYGQYYTMDADGNRTRDKLPSGPRYTHISRGREEYMKLLYGTKSIDCYATRRDCFFKVGNFDEKYRMSEDWDMLFRLTMNYDVGHIAYPIQLIRNHGNSLTTATDLKLALDVHKRIIDKAVISEQIDNEDTFTDYDLVYRKAYSGMYCLFARTFARNHRLLDGLKYLAKAVRIYPRVLLRRDKVVLRTLLEFTSARYRSILARSLVKIGAR